MPGEATDLPDTELSGAMAGPGMKLPPPEKYDGDTDFERFAKLLKAYMGCENNDYCGMLEVAVKRPTPFTKEVITAL